MNREKRGKGTERKRGSSFRENQPFLIFKVHFSPFIMLSFNFIIVYYKGDFYCPIICDFELQ